MSTKQITAMAKKFAIFAVILFIGMWIGGMLSAFLLPIMGIQGTIWGTVIGYCITLVPAWYLLMRFGKKSVGGK